MASEQSSVSVTGSSLIGIFSLDEPHVWYEGAGLSDCRWLVADERGSIVAISNSSGTVTAINTFDEYGQSPALTGRFGYTGQVWLPEAGLYHYKARAYAPNLGRFLQTDPIGFGGGDPQAWLADVLARIAAAPASRLAELLPWNWNPQTAST